MLKVTVLHCSSLAGSNRIKLYWVRETGWILNGTEKLGGVLSLMILYDSFWRKN